MSHHTPIPPMDSVVNDPAAQEAAKLMANGSFDGCMQDGKPFQLSDQDMQALMQGVGELAANQQKNR